MFANTKACQISPDSDFVFENQALEIGCETTCFVYLAAVAARRAAAPCRRQVKIIACLAWQSSGRLEFQASLNEISGTMDNELVMTAAENVVHLLYLITFTSIFYKHTF